MNYSVYLKQLYLSLNTDELTRIQNDIESLPDRYQKTDTLRLLQAIKECPTDESDDIYHRFMHLRGNSVTKRMFYDAQAPLIEFLCMKIMQQNPFTLKNPYEPIMAFAEILLRKELYAPAYDYFKKTLDILSITREPYLRAHVIHRMHNIYPYVHLSNLNKEFTFLLKAKREVYKDIQLYENAFHFYMSKVHLVSKHSMAKTLRHRKLLEVILKNPALRIANRKALLYSDIYILKLRGNIYRVLGDLDNQVRTQQKTLQKLQLKQKSLKNLMPDVYIAEYADYADGLIRQKKFTEATKYLQKAEALLPLLQEETRRKKAVIYNHYLNLSYWKKDPLSMQRYINLIEELLRRYKLQLAANHLPVLMLNLQKAHLSLKNYSDETYWHAQIGGLNMAVVVQDAKHISHIIHLAALYEALPLSFNKLYIEVSVSFIDTVCTLRKEFRQEYDQIPFEIIILNAFSALSEKRKVEEHIKLITQLQTQLGKLKSEGIIYQEQYYRIWEIREWIPKMIEKLKQ